MSDPTDPSDQNESDELERPTVELDPATDAGNDAAASDDGAAPAAADAEAGAPTAAGAASPATEDLEPAGKQRRGKGRMRKVLVGLLVFLTALSVVLGGVTWWVHRTVFDTDKWLSIVGPLPQEPGVSDALAASIVKNVSETVNLQARVTEALPDQLAPLVGPVFDRVRTGIESRLSDFVASDTFTKAWVQVNRVAHDAAIRVLRGETERVITGPDGEVRLNLVPLLYKALDFLQEHASWALRGHTVPTDVDPLSDPQGAVAALSAEFGRSLPPDFAQPVVFTSAKLHTAQQAVHLFDVLFVVSLILPLVLAAIALLVSKTRRRTAVQLAVAAALAVVLAFAVVNRLERAIVDGIRNPNARPAARDTLNAALHGLRVAFVVLLVVALVVAIAAYFAGRPPWVGRLSARTKAAFTGERARGFVDWVGVHADPLRWTGITVAVVAIFLFGISWASVLIVGGLLALYLVGLEAARRRAGVAAAPQPG
jgi:hypothetical protein